jgi:alkanesulfonate monooxygenase SsuD/methylene tetrahydromethanopterin reductase-like flavin-dependent oxidoreductase (luciferase family)
MASATAVLLGHVAEHTQRIRLGSGGVMLPNHAPLMVAEHYGTLATCTATGSTSASAAPRAPTR